MKKVIIVLLVLVIMLLTLSGCFQNLVKKALGGANYSSKDDSFVLKTEDGEAIVSGGKGQKWPTGKMGDLPEFKGNITSSISTKDGEMLTFDGVTMSDVKAYITKVKAAGYEGEEMALSDNLLMFQSTKGDYGVYIQFSCDSKDAKGTCIITYGKS